MKSRYAHRTLNFFATLLFLLVGVLNGYAQNGNTCATPINIAALPYNSPAGGGFPNPAAHTTCGKGNDYTATMACGNSLMNSEDFVYTYTPTAGASCLNIQLNPSTGTLNADAALFVFNGCPNLPTTSCVAQAVNNAGFGNNRAQISNLQLTAGQTYYIVVAGGTACFAYRLNVSPGNCTTPIAGTSCADAIDIQNFPYVSGNVSTAGKGDDYNRGNACQAKGLDGEDMIYKIDILTPACFRVKGKGTNGLNFSVFRGCPNLPTSTCVISSTCDASLCDSLLSQFTLNLPGDYYLVFNSSVPTSASNFSFLIERSAPDDNVTCATCFNEENCSSCKNAGFEKSSFLGWLGYTGFYATPNQTLGLTNTVFNSITSRHTVVTRGNYDFVIGPALSVVSPLGNDYAVRLGNYLFNEDNNNNTRGDAEQLSYTFTVDSTNTNFIYSYAVVFEDPNHAVNEQPYFLVNMFAGGQEIACARYEVRASANAEGFQNGPPSPQNKATTRWKDWTTVNIPLVSFIGQTVTVNFVTKDCSRDGHFGYAYVDAKCGKIDLLQSKTVLCGKDTIDVTAPEGFDKYQWSSGEKTRGIRISKPGSYTVTMTTITGCVVVNTIKIDQELPPNFNYTFTCIDSTFHFKDASIAAANSKILGWVWSFGDGDSSFIQHPDHKYLADGKYSVTLKLITSGGCNLDTTIIIDADISLPKGPLNALDTIYLCEKMDLNLKSDSIIKSVYEWKGPNGFSSNKANPTKLKVTPQDSGWYRLKVRIKDCYDIFDSTYVFIEPLKKVEISKDTILCFGDSAQLIAKGGKTYLWTPSAGLTSTTIPNPKAGPAVTTEYAVTMFNDLCPDTTLFVEIQVLVGSVSLKMPDTLYACVKGTINITANTTGFDTFKWKGPNGYTSTLPNPVIANMDASKVGYYFIDASISDNVCLTGYDSVYLAINPDPKVVINPKPVEICFGDSISFTVTGAKTYVWTPATTISNVTTNKPIVFPKVTTSYIVTGTDVNGCIGKDTIIVTVKPNPQPNLGPDKLLCLGDSTILSLTNTYDSIFWNTGARTAGIQVKLTNDYNVLVWNQGCFGKDTVKVTFQDPGSFDIGPDTLLCAGTPFQINIAPSDSIFWNDGNRSFSRTITTSGIYSVIVYSGTCILKDTISVQFDVPPVINIGPDSTFCLGGSYFLNAFDSKLLSYQWSNGKTTPGILVNTSGTYIVTALTQRCIVKDTVVVTVVTPPVLNIGPDGRICDGDSVRFGANAVCDNYLWNTGETTRFIQAKQAGDYILVAKFGPCTVSDTANLNVEFPKALTIGPDVTICEDQYAKLSATPGFSKYLWNTGATTREIDVNIQGVYSVTATAVLCTSYDAAGVIVDTIPDFQLFDDTICSTSSKIFSSPLTANTYQWTNGATTKDIEVKETGVYGLTIVNGKCSYSSDAMLTAIEPPILDIGPDAIVCQYESARFGTVVPNSTYQWNTGDSTAFITVRDTGKYVLHITYYEVCDVYDEAYLRVIYYPNPKLGPDKLYCGNRSVELNPNTFGDTFKWNTGEETETIEVTKSGTYIVVADNQGCVNSDTINIRFQNPHYVKLPSDKTFCAGDQYYITSTTNARNPHYKWSNGLRAADIEVRTPGDYVLTVTDSVCVARDTIHIYVNPNPTLAPQTYEVCPGDSVTIELPSKFTYQQVYNGEAMNERVFKPYTFLDFYVYDDNGCKGRTQVIVDLDKKCGDLYVPNTFTPNNDGKNDIFYVVHEGMKLDELLIFDRWGEVIFRTKTPEIGWNGELKGIKCKSDVYNWKLIYRNLYDEKKVLFGKVTLLK